MARLWIPGVIMLLAAFILTLLTAISLPYLHSFDIARSRFDQGVVVSEAQNSGVRQLRLGVWAPCFYNQNAQSTCYARDHGYSVSVQNPQRTANVVIGPSWTRGLAVHPVAAVVTFFALLFAFSQHLTISLIASILSFLAAILTLIAFAIDIALFVRVRHEVNKLPGVRARTTPGPGFWLTLVSLILLLLAGCTVCLGRRRARAAPAATPAYTSEKPWSRLFRRRA